MGFWLLLKIGSSGKTGPTFLHGNNRLALRMVAPFRWDMRASVHQSPHSTLALTHATFNLSHYLPVSRRIVSILFSDCFQAPD